MWNRLTTMINASPATLNARSGILHLPPELFAEVYKYLSPLDLVALSEVRRWL